MWAVNYLKAVARRTLERMGYTIHRLRTNEQAGSSGFPYVSHQSANGHSFDFWITDPGSCAWYDSADKGQNLPELNELLRFLRPGDRILEVGSNQGFFSVLLGKLVGPAGRVLGVEAHPSNVLHAQANLGLNRLSERCSVIHAAAAESSGGSLRFSDSMNAAVENKMSQHYVTAAKISGDDLDSTHGPFNVLKVDVEGFELSVLKGCTRLLERRPKLALELHLDLLKEYGASLEAICELIRPVEYEGVMIVRGAEPQVSVFSPDALPKVGIVNLLLSPRS